MKNDTKKISENQTQTADTFGYKWAKLDTFESEASLKRAKEWLFERYCGGKPEVREQWFANGPKTILDAGCGAAMSALLLFDGYLSDNHFIGVDISDAVFVAKNRFEKEGLSGEFHKSDLLNSPVPDNSVDIILSEGVLHHTDSVRDAIISLTTKLKPGGKFMFYVYVKKSPMREYSDDYIREQLVPMDNDEAWEALKPLTKLGIALGELDITIDVPEDVELLGIKKGPQNLQRLLYWNFCKMYYDPTLTMEEMNHINFDWFRPLNCIRSTPEEIRSYCQEAGLDIDRMDVQEAGITVIATRK
nr:class I SAM-dependent methyltransferase [Pseudodesulfovibrio sp.]